MIAITAVAGAFGQAFTYIFGLGAQIIAQLGVRLEEVWGATVQGLAEIATTVGNIVYSIAEDVWSGIQEAVDLAVNGTQWVWREIVEPIGKFLQPYWQDLKAIAQYIH